MLNILSVDVCILKEECVMMVRVSGMLFFWVIVSRKVFMLLFFV